MMIIDVAIVTCSFFLPFGDSTPAHRTKCRLLSTAGHRLVIFTSLAAKLHCRKPTSETISSSSLYLPNWHEIAITSLTNPGPASPPSTAADSGLGTKAAQLPRGMVPTYDAERIYEIVAPHRCRGPLYHQSEARSVYGNGFGPLKKPNRHTCSISSNQCGNA